MAEARYELGLIGTLKAEALGVPGQRRFRLLVAGPGGNACLWLEKEQLFQLALAIRQMVAMLASQETLRKTSRHRPGPLAPGHASLEFEVGKLGLSYEPQADLFLVQAHNREADQEGEAILGFWASRSQLDNLAEEALAVCASGRPLCPLCSAPMGPEPHICPRGNGHRSLPAPSG